MFKIGLAAIRHQPTIERGVARIEETLRQCRDQGVDIVCFPEAYLPGLRGTDLEVPPPDQEKMSEAMAAIQQHCRIYTTAAIVGMEWQTKLGLHNRAYVFSEKGELLGFQTKNQITPGGESQHYTPDGTRNVFEIKGVRFGIVICHEGWRYPETVRWAAVRGAQIVFQPQWTGNSHRGRKLSEWGNSIYEKAMVCRSVENTVYFASVNVCLDYQTSATSLIDPDGRLIDHVPYGEERLLIADLDMTKATGRYAKRFDPSLYPS